MTHSIDASSAVTVSAAAEPQRSRKRWLILLLGIVIVGGAIRARNVVNRPLWEDESYTWKDSKLP